MKINIYIISLLLVLASIYPLSAQVAMGIAAKPAEGAILDLKTEIVSDDSADSDKGLLLPRVLLIDVTKLEPLVTAMQEAETGLREAHTGLVVYNLTENASLGKGLYVWYGTIWMPLTNSNFARGDDKSNSFILSTDKEGIDIPIAKAYEFWKNYKAPLSATYGFNSGNNASVGAVDVNVDLNTLINTNGKATKAVLIWMDQPNLVGNVKANSNDLISYNSSGNIVSALYNNNTPNDISDDYIRVFTGFQQKEGNAVVSLMVDDVVYWSWHVWITNYDPNTLDVTTIGNIPAKNGDVYRYNNTSVVDGNYVFMDRNIGSISNQLDNNNLGLHYQWGRSNPFPSMKNLDNTTKKIYDAKGEITNLNIGTVSAVNNLANAIQNPLHFYGYNATVGVGKLPTYDWYTNVGYTNFEGDKIALMNDNLWNDGGQKTVFDPCPKGWRVPHSINGDSPWFSTLAKGNKIPANYTSKTFDKGHKFDNVTLDYVLGNYPASGYINSISKAEEGVSTTGRIWTSSPSRSTHGASSFEYGSTNVNPWANAKRAHAYSVRCIQEN